MKLFLFGGAESGQVEQELKMIEKVIRDSEFKQVLHIPFARIRTDKEEWMPGWFHRNIELGPDVEYLDASNPEDVKKANHPLVFISGGSENVNLLEKIKDNPVLLSLILEADCIIGESAGAKILAEYFRAKGRDVNSAMVKGLGLIKDTVIEPHYVQRNRQELLIKDMEETKVHYGLGIGSLTAAEFNLEQFPDQINKIGDGLMELKQV